MVQLGGGIVPPKGFFTRGEWCGSGGQRKMVMIETERRVVVKGDILIIGDRLCDGTCY
jgi:hypothetical protein